MSALDFRTFEPTGSLAEDKSYLAGAKIMKHHAKALDEKDCATRSRAAMPRTGGPGSAVPKYGAAAMGGGPNAILSKLWEDATDGGVDIDRGSSGLRLVRARKQPPDNGHWRLELGLLAPGRDGKSQGPLVTNPTEAKKSVALGKTSDRASPGHQGPPSTGQRRNGLFLKMVEAKNSPGPLALSGCYQGPKDACCIRGRGAVAARSSVAPTTRSHGFGLDSGETGAPLEEAKRYLHRMGRLAQNHEVLPQMLARPKSESLRLVFLLFDIFQRQTYIGRPRSIHYRLAGRCLCFFAEGVSTLFIVFVFLKPCPDLPWPSTHHHHHHLVPSRT
ncbi:hypothetical protein CPAR01_09403 [Colletotrichum paranaense]|uniref:Uncharacterized protein n=1 Tax=Colletotrichum paranaense TaxID=1914294 RepID=A0ABQ9SHE5_9PEZI|nr:uncharacterized protein CPAR01_09403 [Colletotrichum paranaense]KAK1535861.1 hypothetical protein CPAR01_09403 [Colletotrichum paranaense]